ncbi:hypothetical protein [Actinoplanes couchii]|uniref:hypothetical protein n=1 Tax=Actinoplanes couchii TaxID=403638 RepID=UPI00194084BA|nr:hypothetical protein [Actinoplanes couchii]MDR6319308.1 hypothetical protein [Actinoplanes couchii]
MLDSDVAPVVAVHRNGNVLVLVGGRLTGRRVGRWCTGGGFRIQVRDVETGDVTGGDHDHEDLQRMLLTIRGDANSPSSTPTATGRCGRPRPAAASN